MNFFERVYGGNANQVGYMCFVTRDQRTQEPSSHRWLNWPREKNFADKYAKMRPDEDVYFSVAIYSQNKSRTSSDEGAYVKMVWADADTCPPEKFILEPTLQIETSPGRWHCLWLLDEFVPASTAQEVSRAIAYKHQKDGCDISGWTASKILRVPGTTNTKYEEPFTVTLQKDTGRVYTLEEIEEVYTPLDGETMSLEDLGDMPQEADSTLDLDELENKYVTNSDLTILYLEKPEFQQSWSERLRKLELELFRQGATPQEVFTICWNSRCNKYNPEMIDNDSVTQSGVKIPKRRNGRAALWKDVSKAYAYHIAETDIIVPDNIEVAVETKSLLSLDERRLLSDNPTFIDDYVKWALSRSPDHASIFSYSLAWQALSCAYGDIIRYDTLWGAEIPNLWTFIGAGSTRNHKSTARKLWKEFVTELEIRTGKKLIVANDFTPEKLITELGNRDGQVSVIDYDEVQGWFRDVAVTKYRSGTYSTLSKLYDGEVPIVLRATEGRGNEHHATTVLNFVGVGILDQIASALTHDDFISGFMLRSTWAIAEAPPYKRGDGDIKTSDDRVEVDSGPFYDMVLDVEDNMSRHRDGDAPFTLRWTDDALKRMNQFTHQVTEYGLAVGSDMIMPYSERLRSHVSSCAALIAYHRQNERIELFDVLVAIQQGERWLHDFEKLVSMVSTSDFGRKCDELETYIASGKDGCRLESEIYGKFKYRLRDFDELKNTLFKSGRIKPVKGEKQLWQSLS